MEEVTYFTKGVEIPATATNTEITTYMWPGFLGEFDHGSLVFTAWELVGPVSWLLRPDIVGPPHDCLGVCTMVTRQWVGFPGSPGFPGFPGFPGSPGFEDRWSSQGSVIRRLRPQVQKR